MRLDAWTGPRIEPQSLLPKMENPPDLAILCRYCIVLLLYIDKRSIPQFPVPSTAEIEDLYNQEDISIPEPIRAPVSVTICWKRFSELHGAVGHDSFIMI
jgi:hypothetical protein